jgi:hypothetical protein
MSAPVSGVAQAAQPAAEDLTAASKWLVREEIFRAADELESFSACIKEAARRGDDARIHGYFADVVRVGSELRSADDRLSALAKMGGGQ